VWEAEMNVIPLAPVERILKYSEPFLTVNKGSDFGASFLNEVGSPLPKKGVVHYVIIQFNHMGIISYLIPF